MLNKTVIFSMGLPGAGKSTMLKKVVDVNQFTLIDPDEVKKTHKDYDPKDPNKIHEWSKAVCNKMEIEAIKNNRDIIIDGTGTNTEKMLSQFTKYQKEGYYVKLFYVEVSLENSLLRNAKRDRNVPEYVIMEKYELINKSWDILSQYANESIKVNNN